MLITKPSVNDLSSYTVTHRSHSPRFILSFTNTSGSARYTNVYVTDNRGTSLEHFGVFLADNEQCNLCITLPYNKSYEVKADQDFALISTDMEIQSI